MVVRYRCLSCSIVFSDLLLLRLLCKHGSGNLGDQLQRLDARLDRVQAHVRPSRQVLHLTRLGMWLGKYLLLLDWSCYQGVACRCV